MRISPEHQASLNVVPGRAPLYFAMSTIVTLASFAFFPLELRLVGGGLLIGAVAAGLMLVSLRFYHFWLSWLIWVVPTTAVLAVALASAQSMRIEPMQMIKTCLTDLKPRASVRLIGVTRSERS